MRHTNMVKQIKSGNPKPRKRDDLLWKSVLEEIFDDFLRFFFPNADELFDLSRKIVYLDKEFDLLVPTEKNGAKGVRYVDKLAKVFLKNGGERWIAVHVEVQHRKDGEDLSARMLKYWYLIKDKHHVSITALAILTDASSSFRPEAYVEEYLGTKLTYEFNTYKILDQNEDELRANPNPFALVILVVLMAIKRKDADDLILKEIKHDLIKELIGRKVSRQKRRGILNFIKYHVNFKNPEMMVIFESEYQELLGRSTTMGTEEYLLQKRYDEGIQYGMKTGMKTGIKTGMKTGIQKGIAQGRHEEAVQIARNLRNKGISLEMISEATGFSIEEIQSL